jgi:hypothetical protein
VGLASVRAEDQGEEPICERDHDLIPELYTHLARNEAQEETDKASSVHIEDLAAFWRSSATSFDAIRPGRL